MPHLTIQRDGYTLHMGEVFPGRKKPPIMLEFNGACCKIGSLDDAHAVQTILDIFGPDEEKIGGTD